MQTMTIETIRKHCPSCCRFLDKKLPEPAAGSFSEIPDSNNLPDFFASLAEKSVVPPFVADLCRLELALKGVGETDFDLTPPADGFQINPSLTVLELSWQGLPDLILPKDGVPEEGRQVVMVWKKSGQDEPCCKVATDEDLLVLKLVLENISPADAALAGGLPIGAIDLAIAGGVESETVLSPPSAIKRGDGFFPEGCLAEKEKYSTIDAFTLQWHLTQACDLHCRHCYDRSRRDTLDLEQGIAVLDDFREFCRNRHVDGQVSFSGGNPLLYPYFKDLYRAAADRGLAIGILGNPAKKEILEELIGIQHPAFFQVSLEGLAEHNDYIRGEGHFERIMAFLEILKELGIYSMVMLTLTRDNQEQVIPLGEMLKGRVDSFTFNRLAMVGEGASLYSCDPDGFRDFLARYQGAAMKNPVMRLKDNLFNLLRMEEGKKPIGGCTGYGCGAAFNFITLLPDGEVHACRKLPSLVGNILEQSLGEIFDSEAAERYRQGSRSCDGCRIRPVCGGCQAVGYGFGLDIGKDRDPYCFLKE
ncbi:MAG: selenobiotic family peptide radical SAM maturase [Proteobacteria bacterium]|nr:selenobiotic family peptide radical SAM maturase [Pseudomonadota bacterium]MBU1739075.1 selenobiotic family peptide radical SAM maturase [Pseudomonadota bacterium]